MALLDALKKKQLGAQAAAQQDVAGAAGTANQTAGLLATKGGKATTGSGPKASSLGEGAAIDEAKAALSMDAAEQSAGAKAFGVQEQSANAAIAQQGAQLDAQRQLSQEELAAQAANTREGIAAGEQDALARLTAKERTQIDATAAEAERTINNLLSQRGIAEDEIFQQFNEENRELAFRRDAAQLEQLSQAMALRDRAYLDELNAIGDERRLRDSVEWQRETARVLMGEEVTDVLQKIGWQEADLADDLAFQRKVAEININEAIAIMNAELAQANQTAMISGVGQLGQIAATQYFDNAAAARAQEQQNLSTIKQADALWDTGNTNVQTASNYDFGGTA